MPREWFYRASAAQEGSARTRELAETHGFIVRSPYTRGEKQNLIALVKEVRVGDTIHLYFTDSKLEAGGASLGAYRVVAPEAHPSPANFGPAAEQTALRSVAAGPLREQLRQHFAGYEPGPAEVYFGWPVVHDGRESPAFARDLFPGRNSLRERT